MLTELRKEISSLTSLSIPMTISTLLESSVGFINIMMLGRIGTEALAAGALVTNFFMMIMMIFWGVFSACNILVANAYGKNNAKDINKIICSTGLLAIISGILMALILWRADTLLALFGQPASSIKLTSGYFHGLAITAVADLFTFTIFNFLLGISRANTTLLLSIIYVPLNVIANYILVFGCFGLPKMGVSGLGYGTAIAFWLLVLFCCVIILSDKNLRCYFKDGFHFDWQTIREIIQLGLPQGLFWTLTFIFFFIIALLMGQVSEDSLAAYQIAMQWYYTIFIVTYCIGNAVSIKISEALGQGKTDLPQKIIRIDIAARILNLVPFLFSAFIFIGFPHFILYTDFGNHPNLSANLSQLAYTFFILVTIYYFFSGNRYIATRVLMGLKDSWFIFWAGFISWLFIGAPLSYWLNIIFPQKSGYLWSVMMLTEFIIMLALLGRYKEKLKQIGNKNHTPIAMMRL